MELEVDCLKKINTLMKVVQSSGWSVGAAQFTWSCRHNSAAHITVSAFVDCMPSSWTAASDTYEGCTSPPPAPLTPALSFLQAALIHTEV